MSDKKLDERDFHEGEGHRIPIFLGIAWTIYFIVAITYLIKYMWPNLMLWINK